MSSDALYGARQEVGPLNGDSDKPSRKYNRLNRPNFSMVIILSVPAYKLGRIG
jgi:hypothetical protein